MSFPGKQLLCMASRSKVKKERYWRLALPGNSVRTKQQRSSWNFNPRYKEENKSDRVKPQCGVCWGQRGLRGQLQCPESSLFSRHAIWREKDILWPSGHVQFLCLSVFAWFGLYFFPSCVHLLAFKSLLSLDKLPSFPPSFPLFFSPSYCGGIPCISSSNY